MSTVDFNTRSRGFGDVFAVFVLILSLAVGLQAYAEVSRYAELRANGITVSGTLARTFFNPTNAEHYAIYYFVLDGNTYTSQQVIDSDLSDMPNNSAIPIIYMPNDPEVSRIQGTETYSVAVSARLIVCTLLGILSLQYTVAYYAKQTAWTDTILSWIQGRL